MKQTAKGFLTLAMVALSLSANAADFYVSPTGSASATGTRVSSPLRSINAALDRAQPGDSAMLMPVKYYEDVSTRRAGTETSKRSAYGASRALLAALPAGLFPRRFGTATATAPGTSSMCGTATSRSRTSRSTGSPATRIHRPATATSCCTSTAGPRCRVCTESRSSACRCATLAPSASASAISSPTARLWRPARRQPRGHHLAGQRQSHSRERHHRQRRRWHQARERAARLWRLQRGDGQ